MAFGRPTTYNDEVLKRSYEYLECFTDRKKQKELTPRQLFPSIEGLCRYIGRARSTVYKWASDEGKEDFSDIVNGINEMQHLILQNEGASGVFNPTIAKLLLAKHGHSDRVEQDHKSSDGSMTPHSVDVHVTKDDIVAALKDIDGIV